MKALSIPSALLLLAACEAPPYAALTIDSDAEMASQVVVSDASLQGVVRVGHPLIERMNPDGQLRVIVPVRNIDQEEIQILAQFAFLNAQRQPLPDETNSQVKILRAGSTMNVEAISRGREAADFTLRLTWNK
jgi:uncharacterized lipoprotein YajG